MVQRVKQQRRRRFPTKALIILGLVLVLAGGAAFWYNHNKTPAQAPVSITATPPTSQDKANVEANKDKLVEQQTAQKNDSAPTPTTTTVNGKKAVSVAVVSANRSGTTITSNGYVSGVVEDGGTCTVTVSKAGQSFSATKAGIANASTTTCPPISVTQTAIAGDGWTAVLSYSSTTASGSSDPETVY